jgi:hypothetical protein
MGLIILPVAAVAAMAWFSVACGFAAVAALLVRKLAGGWILPVLVGTFVLFGCWYVPNAKNLAMQHRLDKVNADCGWLVHKNAPPVTGIYAEHAGTGDYSEPPWQSQFFKVVQYPRDGKVFERVLGNSTPVAARTFRYGVRVNHEKLTHGIERTSTSVVDFDKREVLARHVDYSFPTTDFTGILDIAVRLITVQPKACPNLPPLSLEYGMRDVLPTVKGSGRE